MGQQLLLGSVQGWVCITRVVVHPANAQALPYAAVTRSILANRLLPG